MYFRLQGRIQPQSFRSQYCIQYQWLQRIRSISFDIAQLLIWRISFASVYTHTQFNQMLRCHFRVLLLLKHHHLILAAHILPQQGYWVKWSHGLSLSLISVLLLLSQNHIAHLLEKKAKQVIFFCANQILSQNQKYKLRLIIRCFFILKMTKYKTLFFLFQNQATSWCKQNQYCAQHFSSWTMCPLK